MSENNGAVGYIHDGYTRQGYIAPLIDEKSGQAFHPAVKFEYRPMLVADRNVLIRRIDDAQAKGPKGVEEAEKISAEEMAKRIVSWDLQGPNGTVPCNKSQELLRIEPHLSGRILGIILGFELGDKYTEQEEADAKN